MLRLLVVLAASALFATGATAQSHVASTSSDRSSSSLSGPNTNVQRPLPLLAGEVMRVRTVWKDHEQRRIKLVLLWTESFGNVVVDLGAENQTKDIGIRNGSEIAVRGNIIDMGDYELLKAREVWNDGRTATIPRPPRSHPYRPDSNTRNFRKMQKKGVYDPRYYDNFYDKAMIPERGDADPYDLNDADGEHSLSAWWGPPDPQVGNPDALLNLPEILGDDEPYWADPYRRFDPHPYGYAPYPPYFPRRTPSRE
jgi:hypothetical protein